MKSIAALFTATLLVSACTLDDLLTTSSDPNGALSFDEKIVLGLKTALEVGIDSSSGLASKVNGYLANKAIKILLPEEASQALAAAQQVGAYVQPFSDQLSSIKSVVDFTSGIDQNGFTNNLKTSASILTEITQLQGLGDSLVKYMNRAAELAAPRSVPIFKNVITNMSIADGLSLLNNADSTAATSYLNGKTFAPLVVSYTPIVDSTLSLVPLAQYWGDFRSLYNSVLAKYKTAVAFQVSWNNNVVVSQVPSLQVDKLKAVDNQPIKTQSLGQWTTEKGLAGLFYLVGEQEKDIRRDPFSYVKNLASSVSSILKEVFGDIMKMPK